MVPSFLWIHVSPLNKPWQMSLDVIIKNLSTHRKQICAKIVLLRLLKYLTKAIVLGKTKKKTTKNMYWRQMYRKKDCWLSETNKKLLSEFKNCKHKFCVLSGIYGIPGLKIPQFAFKVIWLFFNECIVCLGQLRLFLSYLFVYIMFVFTINA